MFPGVEGALNPITAAGFIGLARRSAELIPSRSSSVGYGLMERVLRRSMCVRYGQLVVLNNIKSCLLLASAID